ncbi:HK97-gp10 family putative phage morphogenesis protein [Lactobacillus acetotolerans]|uniref:HK97-gp10 family putative phage morphogenesis protein n=1 Tax=Lactobacillus acetotolerans TaxID=1600 RepID=UPI002FD8B7EE
MTKSGIQFKGIEELYDGLMQRANDRSTVKNIIRKHGGQLVQKTQSNMGSAYTGHMEGGKHVMPTGATKRSVKPQIRRSGLEVMVTAYTDYFPYLELGTRKMSARPTLKPAFEVQKRLFINELKQVMK